MTKKIILSISLFIFIFSFFTIINKSFESNSSNDKQRFAGAIQYLHKMKSNERKVNGMKWMDLTGWMNEWNECYEWVIEMNEIIMNKAVVGNSYTLALAHSVRYLMAIIRPI